MGWPVSTNGWQMPNDGEMCPPARDASDAAWLAWCDDFARLQWQDPLSYAKGVTRGFLERLLAASGLTASVAPCPKTATVRIRIRGGRMAMCAALSRWLHEHASAAVFYDVAPEEGTADAVMSKALAEKAAQAIAAAKPVPVVVAEPPTMRRLLDMGKPIRVVAFVDLHRRAVSTIEHLQKHLGGCQSSLSVEWPNGTRVRFVKRERPEVCGLRADVVVGDAPPEMVGPLFWGPDSMRVHVVGEAAERAFWGMEAVVPHAQHGDIVLVGDHWQYMRATPAQITTECFPEMLKIARETGLPVHATMLGVHVIARRNGDLAGLTQAWMSAKDGDTVDARSANATQVRRATPIVRVDRETDEELRARLYFLGDRREASHASDVVDAAWFATKTIGAPTVAIGEFFASITRWAATPEGQRAIRDLHVRRACEDVPPGCDAKRWRNVVHVIAADAVEKRYLNDAQRVEYLHAKLLDAAPSVQMYGRLRFCFRYPERDAVKETLAAMGCNRCPWTERMLRAYEVNQ